MGTPMIDVRDEFEDVDPFYVGNKDDNFYYCWVNKKPENIERRKLEGYEAVTDTDKANALTKPNAIGERVLGDVVLMRMPRERYERLQRRLKERIQNQLDAANEAKSKEIEDKGFETINETTRSRSASALG